MEGEDDEQEGDQDQPDGEEMDEQQEGEEMDESEAYAHAQQQLLNEQDLQNFNELDPE